MQQTAVSELLTKMFNSKVAKNWTRINEQFAVSMDHVFQMGKYGRVNLGFSYFINRMIAVKIIQKVPNYEQQLQILKRNQKLIHFYFMRYYGYCFWEDKIYIFLEVCPFGTLNDRIGNKMTQLQVLRAFRQLVEGVRYLHQNGKVHKDLKPDNILLGPERDIKICDFGLVNEESESIFESGYLGTAQYAAPEVLFFEGQPEDLHSFKSDVWSVGAILYEMLTGRYVFENAKNYDQLKGQWLKLERGNSSIRVIKFNETLHPIWQHYVNWLMTFRQESRPTIEEVYNSIRAVYPYLLNDVHDNKHQIPFELREHIQKIKANIFQYQFLLQLSEIFTTQDIRLRNEFKYMMMFCLIMRFLTFCKKFLSKIVNVQIRVEGKMSQGEVYFNPYGELMAIRERNQLEQKYHFYKRQVQKVIVPKILDVYCQRQQSKLLMEDMRKIVQEVKRFRSQQTQLQQEVYDEALQSILKVIELRHGDVTKVYNRKELVIYGKILLAMLMTDHYLKDNQKSLIMDIQKLQDLPHEELVDHVKALSEEVC